MCIILSQSFQFHTPSIQPRLIAVKNTFKQKKPKECWSRLEWRINAANGYYKEHMYICLWDSNLLKLKERRRMVHQKHSESPFYQKYTRFNGLSCSSVVCIYMKYSPIIIEMFKIQLDTVYIVLWTIIQNNQKFCRVYKSIQILVIISN